MEDFSGALYNQEARDQQDRTVQQTEFILAIKGFLLQIQVLGYKTFLITSVNSRCCHIPNRNLVTLKKHPQMINKKGGRFF